MSEFEHLADTFQATQEALQKHATRAVDSALVVRNWLFGWYLVAFENAAAERSELYGKELINKLSKRLKDKGMKGISPTNLRKFREFYQAYLEIQQTASVTSLTELGSASFLQTSAVSQKIQQTASVESSQMMPQVVFKQIASSLPLGWSHYVELLTIDSTDERRFYEIEAAANQWTVRELKRQIASSLYERLALSRHQEENPMNPGYSILAPTVCPISAQGIALGSNRKWFRALKGRPKTAFRVIAPAPEFLFPSTFNLHRYHDSSRL